MCGQCHVEYYFTDPGQGVAKKPVFPWAEGKDPEQIYGSSLFQVGRSLEPLTTSG
jgi:formate-dependent nitrite reductase cytochrome c552 subunit